MKTHTKSYFIFRDILLEIVALAFFSTIVMLGESLSAVKQCIKRGRERLMH